MKVSNTTLVKLGRMCRFAFALAILLRCDAAMAGKFFFDDFEDGNHMDASPVSWQASSALGFQCCSIDMSDGELQFTTTANEDVSADSLDSNYRDGIFRTQLSWNAFGSSRAYAGLYVRGAENGRAIWAGMQPGGGFGMGRSGPGLFTVAHWQANSSLDPFDGYVNLELAVKGTRFSMTAWQEGQTRPSRPQFTFSDSNFSVGTVGLSADSNSNSMTNVGFSYFQALPYLSGDYSDSGELDVADIDLLSDAIRAGNNLIYDLDGNGVLDQDDRSTWVEDLFGTFFGDADLDKEVAFADFLALSSNFGLDGGWAEGDFDGNGQIQFPDFLMLSANFGKSATAVAAVPEPSTAMLLLVGLVCFVRTRSIVSRKVWLP